MDLVPDLLDGGAAVLLGHALERIVGGAGVEGVVLRAADGATRAIECDGVIVSGRFTPEATLARLGHLVVDARTGGPAVDQYGRCSDPHFYAAGNGLRAVETAGWSWREGVRTAESLAAGLAGRLPPADAGAELRTDGEALRYVLPQRLALPDDGHGMRHAQLRVSRAVRGRLVMSRNGCTAWSGHLSSLPERRILLPLAPLRGAAPGDDLRITLDPEA